MEIPEINMISDFGAGIKCLQNPSLVSRFYSLSGIEKAPQVYRFWKWGALIIALFATFSSLIKRIKLIFVYFKPNYSKHLIQDQDFELSDNEFASSSVSSDDEAEDYDNRPTTSSRDDEDFRVKGSSVYWRNGNLRHRRRRSSGSGERFAWSEFTSGKNVVKLWDNLGLLGLDFTESKGNDDSVNLVSLWDVNQDDKISNFFGRNLNIPTGAVASPAMVLTAGRSGKRDGVVFRAYDTRMGRRIPAIHAEWVPKPAAEMAMLGAGGGCGENVYVRDDVSGIIAVGDMRNVKTTLEIAPVTESESDTWWDADAVMVEDEFVLVDESC